jgi:hypothetical protein
MAQKKGGNLNPASLANLKPIPKGTCLNPNGRKGADGKGGVTLKSEFRNYIKSITTEERNAVWAGLYSKAMMGDVAAIKLWVELNGERVVDDVQVYTGSNGPKIIIQMPPMENDDS